MPSVIDIHKESFMFVTGVISVLCTPLQIVLPNFYFQAKKTNDLVFDFLMSLTVFEAAEFVCLGVSPQATGADSVHRGQRGRSRHRADAIHQRGLLQAEEAAARLASDVPTGLHDQAHPSFVISVIFIKLNT